jgi:lipopolysaccharide transport system ATP-binding protein
LNEPAIRVEGVGKRYRLGTSASATDLLTERIAQLMRGRLRQETDEASAGAEDFWALRDVSFDVAPGEALGLIGHNGAGKSTMLKLLSRITPPTEGRITLRGRMASMLEVGTGFHPELTGRENISLNGAILGMRRREIAAKFDDIVEFSGVARFIDTPVKHYSSGMYVRLAFAVAAHLEPEILLVDEVLAVGDAEFQRRCLGRMHEVAEEGRTIVFVSHNLASVRRLCPRALLMDSGRIVAGGPTDDVIAQYVARTAMTQASGRAQIPAGARRQGDGRARLLSVELRGPDGEPADQIRMGRTLGITLGFECVEPVPDATVMVCICTSDGERIATAYSSGPERPPLALEPGHLAASVTMALTLLPGEYTVEVLLKNTPGYAIDWVDRAVRFTVLNIAADGVDDYPWATVMGHIRPEAQWSLRPSSVSMEAH